MRLVIFTGNASIEETPWWRVVCGVRGVERILVCLKTESARPADVWRRQRRNIRKHGWIWVPYRLSVLVGSVLARPFTRHAGEPVVPCAVPVDRIESLDIHGADVLERVAAFRPDLGVSIGAPILQASLFRIPGLGTINLHLGKVPDFRGAPPAFWELSTGASEIGATVHWVNEGLDTGDVIASAVAPIHPADTLEQVESRAEELGILLMTRALDQVARGDHPGSPQPSGGTTRRQPTLRVRLGLSWRLAARRWARLASPRYAAKMAAAMVSLWLLRPVRDVARRVRRRHPVRVFTFHRVSDLCRDGMTVSRRGFREQLAYIARHHDVVPLGRALELLESGARLARPAAALTFDDGYGSVYRFARPAMAEAGLTGCCFVSTALVDTERRFAHDEGSPVREHLAVMTWAELKELLDAGWGVGGHTATHARLSTLARDAMRHELEAPLRELRDHLGIAHAPMAYPFGGRDDITPEAVAEARRCGYAACFSDFGGENFPSAGGFAYNRIEVGGDMEALVWKTAVHGIDLPAWRERLWGPERGGSDQRAS